MKARPVTVLLGLLAILLVAFRAQTANSNRDRAAVFARLPNWSGLWEPAAHWSGGLNGHGDGRIGPPLGLSVDPSAYNPQWLAESRAVEKSRATRGNTTVTCTVGFPAVMNNILMFEALVTPEETALIFSRREIRHIYTDGRDHPAPQDLWPTTWGDSIGHWEGDTLVVETVAAAEGRNASRFSAQARFIERIRLSAADALEDRLTVIDPLALKRPYATTLKYRRVTDIERMVHDDCQGSDPYRIEDGQMRLR